MKECNTKKAGNIKSKNKRPHTAALRDSTIENKVRLRVCVGACGREVRAPSV